MQSSRRRVTQQEKEPLVESQLFIMELARELNRLCQVSAAPPLRVPPPRALTAPSLAEVQHPGPHLDLRRRLAPPRVP